MGMMRRIGTGLALLLAAGLMLETPALGQEGDGAPAFNGNGQANAFAARRLLKLGEELLGVPAEEERGAKMLETVIEQFPGLPLKYNAHLLLGRHRLKLGEFDEALQHFRHLRELGTGDQPPTGEMLEIYLESLYQTGVVYFRQQKYAASFPVLRKITREYPNTVWANQAYYYIGMCHFMQRNWDAAIKNLSLVGTFIDPESPSAKYVEAGRRFYVKVDDGDLPVLTRLGKHADVEVTTGSGDRETMRLIPLSSSSGVYIGSIATDTGAPSIGDGVLQVTGSDTIHTRYTDANAQDGSANVAREASVQVVSTAAVAFTLGTYESQAVAAFIDQPLHVVLHDVDLDSSDDPEQIEVRLISRYKEVRDETAATVERIASGFEEGEETYVTRDEVTMTLAELGEAPVHTGRFGGKITVSGFRADMPVNKSDEQLVAAEGDEIVVSYTDEQHIGGSSPRTVMAVIDVAGTVDTRPRARQNVVTDPVLRARKNIVEGQAFLELARIFNGMGLTDGAKEKAEEGLDRSDQIVKEQEPLPDALKEQAFKLKWELHKEKGEYAEAVATCQLFHQLFPESLLVDEAMMSIAEVKLGTKDYRGAIAIFESVLELQNSQAKARAQYMIAQVLEEEAKQAVIEAKSVGKEPPAHLVNGMPEAAIIAYRRTAEQYPESEFAGPSLGKLVDYYIATNDLTQASDLLRRVFEDYPDAQFLDSMLLKWVLVAYRMGDYQTAYDKCNQLLVEYPSSQYAKQAHNALDRIKERLPDGGGDGEG